MSAHVTPFTPDQVGFSTVRFSSKGVFDTHKDKMVDPYAQTRIPKEAQVEGIKFWPQEKGKFPCIVLPPRTLGTQWTDQGGGHPVSL